MVESCVRLSISWLGCVLLLWQLAKGIRQLLVRTWLHNFRSRCIPTSAVAACKGMRHLLTDNRLNN